MTQRGGGGGLVGSSPDRLQPSVLLSPGRPRLSPIPAAPTLAQPCPINAGVNGRPGSLLFGPVLLAGRGGAGPAGQGARRLPLRGHLGGSSVFHDNAPAAPVCRLSYLASQPFELGVARRGVAGGASAPWRLACRWRGVAS